MTRKIGVLIVDDSPLCRQLIIDAITRDPDIEVVGQAADGEEAVAKAAELKPQVITMDVDMPVLDGLSATERIMASMPTPILVLTADPRKEAPELTHRALAVGALALQVKPAMDAGPDAWNLAREVKLLASVKVIRHLRGGKRLPDTPTPVPQMGPASIATVPFGLVGIVGSTGGPQVLHKLLSELPSDFPVPIVIVQHINAAFGESLVGWLAASSQVKVKVAKDGDLLAPGMALVAPPNLNLVIASRGKVAVREPEKKDQSAPSGTLLLESAARVYGRRAVGVVLTGMGNDGADGLWALKQAGGRTLAQNQESCVVFGMPGAAVAKGAVDHLVDGDDLAQALLRLARGQELPRE